MGESESLISINISLLKQGIALLEKISTEQYHHRNPKLYESGVGKHIRHILDHYDSLLRGWEGKIDYDARTRDAGIETSKDKAIEKYKLIIEGLRAQDYTELSISRQVWVRSNDVGEPEGGPWAASTLKRELQCMVSHTVHHYALIAYMLKHQGVELSADFGLAPSTLQFNVENS